MRVPVALAGQVARLCLVVACGVLIALAGGGANALEVEVRGLVTPPPARLAKALQADDDLLRATAPYVSDEQLCKVAVQKATLALQRQGYRDPEVAAAVQRDGTQRTVVVEVVPGEQQIAGPIEIQGLSAALAERVEAALTSPQPPSNATPRIADAGNAGELQWVNDQGRPVRMDPPLWHVGEPAAVDALFEDELRRLVARCLREEGYLVAAEQLQQDRDTAMTASVHDSKAGGRAQLTLRFAAEPVAATVRAVEVRGDETLAPASVMAFLGVDMGSGVTESQRRQWERQLRESGRFIRQEVSLKTDAQSSKDGSVIALVEVLAYPGMPPLDQPLSREEQTMLRFRSWLRDTLDGPGLELRLAGPAGEPIGACLLSSGRGVVLRVGGDGPDGGAVAVTEAGLGIYLPGGAGRFEVPLASLGQAVVQASLSVRDTLDPEKGTYRHDLSLGASFGSSSAEGDPAAVVSAKVEPVACLALVHRQHTTGEQPGEVRWRENTLEIVNGDGVARFDEQTGRLMDLRVPELGRVEIAAATDWEATLASLRASSGGNVYRAEAPFSSAITFLGLPATGQLASRALAVAGMENALNLGAGWQGLASAVAQAAAGGGFAGVDSRLAAFFAAERERERLLEIPSPRLDKASGDPVTLVLGKLSGKAWSWLDTTCGRDAWPTGLARLAHVVLRGEAGAIFQEMTAFMSSEQAGPVAHLVAASAIPMKPLAASFAMRGSSLLNAAAFAREMRPLLAILEKSGLDVAIVSVVRRLEPDQAADLGSAMFGREDGFVAFVAALQEAATDEAAVQSIDTSLAAWWDASLSERVATALQARGGARMATGERAEPTLKR